MRDVLGLRQSTSAAQSDASLEISNLNDHKNHASKGDIFTLIIIKLSR